MRKTSRSREVAYQNCPRLGYLGYDWGGTGLEPVSLSLPLVNGIAVHEILAAILGGVHPEEAISKELAKYEADVRARGVANEDLDGLEELIHEQSTMLAGTIWAWVESRLPRLRDQFDFLAIERELQWPVSEGGPIMQVRCDALAREKQGGGLYYIEWKTTSQGGEEWAKQWEHNTQLLSNTLAIEEVLGERCEGVIIEGIIKGRRAVDRAKSSPFAGKRIQQSPLCYGYVNELSGEYRAGWTSAKGWTKIATWKEVPIRKWVERVMTEEERLALFAPVPPIKPTPWHLARWREQFLAAEAERAERLSRVSDANINALFPMHDEHCHRYWGAPCAFEPLCFRSAVSEDPLGSGLYQRRVDHHGTGVAPSAD